MNDVFHTQRPITLQGQNDTNQRLAVYVRFRMIVNLHRLSPFFDLNSRKSHHKMAGLKN